MDYPIGEDIYELMKQSRAKTVSADYDEQLDISEELYANQIKFSFTKSDVRALLHDVTEYTSEEKGRVETILYTQMKKYSYLFL